MGWGIPRNIKIIPCNGNIQLINTLITRNSSSNCNSRCNMPSNKCNTLTNNSKDTPPTTTTVNRR